MAWLWVINPRRSCPIGKPNNHTTTWRDYILEELHASHPGISHMKTLSHSFVWWPGWGYWIICQELLKVSSTSFESTRCSKFTLKVASSPLVKLHLGFAGPFMDNMFLIVIDAYSKWLEVKVMKSTTSTPIISSLRSIFARFGLLSVIVKGKWTGPFIRCYILS